MSGRNMVFIQFNPEVLRQNCFFLAILLLWHSFSLLICVRLWFLLRFPLCCFYAFVFWHRTCCNPVEIRRRRRCSIVTQNYCLRDLFLSRSLVADSSCLMILLNSLLLCLFVFCDNWYNQLRFSTSTRPLVCYWYYLRSVRHSTSQSVLSLSFKCVHVAFCLDTAGSPTFACMYA